MENKINVAKILKDCPKGMELNCTMFDDVVFERVDSELLTWQIILRRLKSNTTFITNKYGQYYNAEDGKCVIFPKGKTTWEEFTPPCQFKDGDVLFVDCSNGEDKGYQYIFILNNPEFYGKWHSYCHLDELGYFHSKETYLTDEEYHPRLATEDEKQRLFGAIKDNGYRWNEETKSLEKLEDDDKGNISDGYHTFNELYEYRLLYNASMFNEFAKQGLYDVHKSKRHSDGTIPFGDENWFIVQAELPTGQISNHYEMKDWDLFNVPEKEKANHYDGHTPKDVAKRLRDFLSLKKLIKPKFKVGDKIVTKNSICAPVLITQVSDEFYYSQTKNSVGVLAISDQDKWELAPNKFDISTLKPFDKVLVRHDRDNTWCGSLLSHMDNKSSSYCYKFVTTAGKSYPMGIPYEGNEHLLGTANDCDSYFKTWE